MLSRVLGVSARRTTRATAALATVAACLLTGVVDAPPARDGAEAGLAQLRAADLALAAATPGKPSQANTGVPAGTRLRVHRGDITVTKPGTVLSGLDIRGFVTIKAPDVTIQNSIVRGGRATYNRGLITNYGYRNLLVKDVSILPTYSTVWQDGVKGSNFELLRVYITGNVDSVKIHGGGNVRIRRSLLENTTYFSSDPNQGGRATHNDGVQILDGQNIRIVRNTIRGQQNFAILGAANHGHTRSLVVRGNWLDGGHCTTKFEEMKGYQASVALYNNKFGPRRKISNCAMVATAGTSVLAASGNVMEGTGRPVRMLWMK